MKIKNIVFDVGMVLIDFHWEKTMRELGISEDAIEHLRVNMMQLLLLSLTSNSATMMWIGTTSLRRIMSSLM